MLGDSLDEDERDALGLSDGLKLKLILGLTDGLKLSLTEGD